MRKHLASIVLLGLSATLALGSAQPGKAAPAALASYDLNVATVDTFRRLGLLPEPAAVVADASSERRSG